MAAPHRRATPTLALALAVVAALPACGTARPRLGQDPEPGDPYAVEPEPGAEIDRLAVGPLWVPVFWIEPDTDSDEPGGGLEIDADLADGSGWGAEVELGTSEPFVFHGMVLATEHDERNFGATAHTYSGWVDGALSSRIPLGRHVVMRPEAGLGVGGAAIDYGRGYADTGGAAGMVRGAVRFDLFDRVSLHVDFAGFLWGYPGETIAEGGFITVGGSLVF